MKKQRISKVGKALLDKYLADGTIWIDDHEFASEYVAKNSRDIEISLGCVGPYFLPAITIYLENRPTPDLW